MRRTVAAAVVALSTALTVLPAYSAYAVDPTTPPTVTETTDPAPDPSEPLVGDAPDGESGLKAEAEAVAAPQEVAEQADTALDAATASLNGEDNVRGTEGTLALVDLFRALPNLDSKDRSKAQGLLARPTDGAGDLYGDGYRVRSKSTCSGHFCIHWVPTTADAPPSRAWVTRTLTTMNNVWKREVDQMGYRAPVRDGQRGGNSKFDVYLKDLGSSGLYGYCAPESRKPGTKWLASGYCVLDNDFKRSQYGAAPADSLRVTAAHEFFHAIQFAYDFGEDRWLMEGTATWMEEQVADSVNDNRQYLRFGQVAQPAESLDIFAEYGFNQYGNWPFFQFLSQRYGTGIVRTIWNKVGAFKGAPDRYSTAGVKAALRSRGGFTNVYRAFAAGNTVAARTYAEGRTWPVTKTSRSWRLGANMRKARATVRVNHMASRKLVVRPAHGVAGKRWMLRVNVNGPDRVASPAATVLIRSKKGEVNRRAVNLDEKGAGAIRVRFDSRQISSVTVVLVNASTRFRCWQASDSPYSCQGTPLDDRAAFAFGATVVKP